MLLGTLLLIVVALLMVGALPAWPYSQAWGFGPAAVLGVTLAVILALLLLGQF